MIPVLLSLHLTAAPASATDVAMPPEPATPVETPVGAQETWVGVISVLGSRKIPLLGKIEFQTDTHVLARATKVSETQWDVIQATCEVQFPRTMGATISVEPDVFPKIPQSSFSWVISQDGVWTAGPWRSGWSDKDHDRDGEPGLTLSVAAPFCGGQLYASSEATQTATGRARDGYVVAGDIRVHVIQRTLGTRGPCLRLMAKDSDEWMDGQILLRKAPDDTTCDSATDWPVADWEKKH